MLRANTVTAVRPDRLALLAALLGASVLIATGCSGRIPFIAPFQRPAQLVGEWVDVRHTTPTDTALWVLRESGYDGSAHLLVTSDSAGITHVHRTEKRYGSWYFNGNLADTNRRAICFARRVGRDGATCLAFSEDSVQEGASSRRRLTIRGYQGQHTTSDRVLLERRE
jgi:hypothetical protein